MLKDNEKIFITRLPNMSMVTYTPFTLIEMVPSARCAVGSYLAWDGTFKLDETRDVWKFQIE